MLASKPLEKHYMIEALRQTADGAAILKDWLGEGGVPVPQALSERRAMTCVCCNQNVAPRWWEKLSNRIALTIRKQLAVKDKIQLTTTLDEDLHMCRICGCCLQLKTHVPIQHITDHTKAETMTKFPQHCWIPRETEAK